MHTSPSGRKLIARFEGLRLRAYKDAVGVWTIGYGHTAAAGAPFVYPGLQITREKAEEILAKDLYDTEETVGRWVKVRLTQSQFDALVSLVYNIGGENFRRSSLLKALNRGDYHLAADKFLDWNKAGGRVLPGLVTRRKQERRLFLRGG